MKIIGWTEWDDPNYKEMFPIGEIHSSDAVDSVRKIIAEELKNKGYKFTGTYHQNGDYGVPVFDTGEVFQCSQRMWGGIMAEAYPESDSDGYGYLRWAWTLPDTENMVIPKEKCST